MSDPQRFARLVLAAFEAAGHTTDARVGRAGGPSTSTMTKLRAASQGGPLAEPRSQTWEAIEAAAGWPAGAARRVWEGGDPPSPATPAVRTIGATERDNDDLIEIEVKGTRGVSAVVKGSVRNMDEMQAAAAKLAKGMGLEEPSNVREVP